MIDCEEPRNIIMKLVSVLRNPDKLCRTAARAVELYDPAAATLYAWLFASG